MNTRAVVVAKRSLQDFSSPILLAMFLVPYVGIAYLFGNGTSNTMPDDIGTLPLHIQEAELIGAFSLVSFVWAIGIPMMVLVTVLSANAIAKEAETGTLRILLSKPIRRWEVLFGKFAAVSLFTFLAMVAGLLIAAVAIYLPSGTAPSAIAGSFGALLPGSLAYALLVSFVMGSIGTFVAVVTGSRLRTALGTLLVPGLFLAFIIVKLVPTSGLYEDLHLYLVDVPYHFGNAFVFLHGTFGTEFSPPIQMTLGDVTGVYDGTSGVVDPLLGGMSPSVPLSGYVAPPVSTLLLVVLSAGLLGLALRHFSRADVP